MDAGDLISGKYRLIRLLGEGGMGAVWAARNELTDREFALKSLLPQLASNREALQRFFHEARACGGIKHPAVVDVYDMGEAEDGSPYLVMELLEGEGFDQRLAREGTFRPGEAAAWVAFIARGLEEAHVRGVVHRDLKPGNIFFALDERGDIVPKVLDFGVSKATSTRSDDFVKTTTGAVLGSPAYMSPEQARGEPDIDARSDVWSLGVILYEALTGQVPFDGPNYNALMLAIITKPHASVLEVAPGVPSVLSEIVDLALSKDRAHRIATARDLAEQLEAVAASHGEPMTLHRSRASVPPASRGAYERGSIPPPPGVPHATTQGTWSDGRRAPGRRRSPVFLASVALAAVGLIAAGAGAFMGLRPPKVAVAARTAAVLTAGTAELGRELDRLRAEAITDKTREDEASAHKVAEATAVVELQAKKPVAATPTKPRAKSAKDDPHGGVDSAGF